MRLRSILLTSAGCIAGVLLAAGPAHATGKLTMDPAITGAGTISATDGYGCLTPTADVDVKNADVTNCPSKSVTAFTRTIGGIPIPTLASLSLTASPRDGWQFMGWQDCGILPRGATSCSARISSTQADVDMAPIAVFREIVPVAIGAKPAQITSDATPTFGFSSPVAGTTFTCALDSGAVACPGSSVTLAALADGTYTFKVTGTHNTNPSISPASYKFTVDTVAPDTAFAAGVGPGEGALQTTTSETFKLVSSEPAGATFQCSLDGAPFAACSASVSLTALAPGRHTFAARALDRAGNVDGSVARRTWTIAIPDADGDGFNARADCNDAAPAVFPGANDVAGNGVDENCDGADAVPPAAPPVVVAPGERAGATEQVIVTVAFFARSSKRTTRFTTLQVKNVPLGATVSVKCAGRRCPSGLKGAGFVKNNAFGTVTLAKFIKKPIAAGAVLTVVVSKPDAISAVKIVKVRASKKPLISTKCQPPGAAKPVAC